MTEQSLMITTNEQPCNNQLQNLEAAHQSYLDSSEYELKMANLIAESQLNFDAAFDYALRHALFDNSIRWNTRKAFTDRWYYYGKPIPFIGKTKNIDLVKEFVKSLYSEVDSHADTCRITLQPVDEEYIHKYLARVAMFCLTMIDKESLRYMHNVYGTFSDVERCNSLIVAFKEMKQKTKYLGNSEILRLATLPNSKNQYLG